MSVFYMTRTFIEVPLFTKRWAEIGLTDADLLKLQIMLLKDPESGPIIEGTGGIRKVRFPLENREKAAVFAFAILIFQNLKKKQSRRRFQCLRDCRINDMSALTAAF